MKLPGIMKGLLVPSAVIACYSIAILRLPLFNELGYEFSVSIALIVPVLGWWLVRRRIKLTGIPPRELSVNDLRNVAVSAGIETLLVLVVPFICASINLAIVKNCSYLQGAAFYILIPVVTSFWVLGLVLLCLTLFRKPLLAYTAFLGSTLLYALYLGYATPQIYSYNFVYGFFGGFSYDETLMISPPLLMFRQITLYAGILFYIAAEAILDHRLTKSSSRWGIVGLLCLPLLASWWLRSEIGLESPAGRIQKVLSVTSATEHFTIHTAPGTFSSDEMKYVCEMHEFRFSQVEHELKTNVRGRIDSYIYPDADAKRAFIGTGNTNIAKPWRKEIHLNKESWESTLKHELVHVVAGEFGMPLIHAHYNIGLVEGLAMAVDPEFGNKTLHEYAASMIAFGLISEPGRLVRPVGFATQASSVSYVMMGSFIRFLIDRYGILRFRELYGGASVDKVYGIPYERLAEEWTHLLEGIEVPSDWKKHVDFYFRRPSIFAKECAHAVANANEEGYRQLERNSPASAIQSFSRGLRKSWNSESFAGLARAVYTGGRYDTLISLIDGQMQDSARHSSLINLYLLFGDALWYQNDPVTAAEVYREAASYDLSERWNEAAEVRLAVLRDPRLAKHLAPYIVGSLDDSSSVRLLDSLITLTKAPVVRYLKGKLFLRQRRFAEAHAQLEPMHALFSAPILNSRLEQLLAESCFGLKRYQEARAHLWLSLNGNMSPSSARRVDDAIAKCEWFEGRR